MRAQGLAPVATRFPAADFAAMARAVGAAGARVECESDLDAALDAAMLAEGPFVLDVVIDPDVEAPFLRRIESLRRQAEGG